MNTYTPGSLAIRLAGGKQLRHSHRCLGGDPQARGRPSGVMPTPVDSIEEFSVGTTNQTADFNSSAGGAGTDGNQARNQ